MTEALPLARLGLDEDVLDGPFVLPSGALGLLISPRSRDATLVSPFELHWRRALPAHLRDRALELFVRRGDRALALGPICARPGKPPARAKVVFELERTVDVALFGELVSAASAVLPPAPEEQIAALSLESTLAERMAALRSFAHRWLGADPDAPPRERDVPAALRVLHGLVEARAISVQNWFVPWADLSRVDGHIVFYVESQGVWTWAVRDDGELDPPVLVREGDEGAPWRPECDNLSAFLLAALVYECAIGARFGASDGHLDRRAAAELERRVRPLPLPVWTTTRVRTLGSGGVLGVVAQGGESSAAWIGAREAERLEPIAELFAEWDDVRT